MATVTTMRSRCWQLSLYNSRTNQERVIALKSASADEVNSLATVFEIIVKNHDVLTQRYNAPSVEVKLERADEKPETKTAGAQTVSFEDGLLWLLDQQ